jgi:3-dehydroquinate dehydratase/shikimate dehydrogenase
VSGQVSIGVPIAESTVAGVLAAAKQAEAVADIVEFRLDYLSLPWADLPAVLTTFVSAVEKPVIFTFRPDNEGGRGSSDLETRRRFWLRAIAALSDLHFDAGRVYLDMEVDVAEMLATQETQIPWRQVIVSHHRFDSTPDDLSSIYERLKATPARILKVATLARDMSDSLTIFRVLERAKRDGRPLIAIAMGMAGVMTRVLGPAHGSFLTFGSLGTGAETALGQIPADDLRSLYRVGEISAETPVIGLVGHPVGHSLSPRLHNSWFKEEGLDFIYLPFEVGDLREFMTKFVNVESRLMRWNLRGLSVTLPHKINVIEYLDAVDPLAKRIGAVNTIVAEHGRLTGFNTDVVGLVKPLEMRLPLRNSRVAIIGAGGAARAAAFGLADRGARITIIGRNEEKAQGLAAEVGGEFRLMSEADSVDCDVLVNATPMGMKGSFAEHSAPARWLRGTPLVFDLVYNPAETKLLREAREAGCETLSGVEMFVIQATEQFRLWTGVEPSLDAGYALVYTWST